MIDGANKYQRYLQGLADGLASDEAALSGSVTGLLPVGALGVRTRHLIDMALAIALSCDDSIEQGVRAAFTAGARVEEITETVGVAVVMSGGKSLNRAARALEVLVNLEEERAGYAMRSGA